MKCSRCGYWYSGTCYNTNTEKDALNKSCASYTPFNRSMYIAIKNGNIAFIQTIKEEGVIIK